MAIGCTNRGSESIRAGTFRQMRPKFGFAILYTMLLPQYLGTYVIGHGIIRRLPQVQEIRAERSGAQRFEPGTAAYHSATYSQRLVMRVSHVGLWRACLPRRYHLEMSRFPVGGISWRLV